MPYSRLTHSRDFISCYNYIFSNKAHVEGRHRNELVGTVGFLPESTIPYPEQIEHMLKKRSAKNKTDIRRLIVSFAPDELPPNDMQSKTIALKIGMEIMERGYRYFPAIIAVQNDGEADKGLWHIHILAVNVNTSGKGFSDDQTKYWYLRKITDEVCSQYFENKEREPAFERYSQAERGKRIENEDILKENKKKPTSEQKPLNYIWKDDLKARVRSAMESEKATDYESFVDVLSQNGVSVEYRHTKNKSDFLVYELMDTSRFTDKIPRNLKSKSYKLGAGFGLEALTAEISKHLKADTVSADYPEPTLSGPFRQESQPPVMPSAQIGDNIGSTSHPVSRSVLRTDEDEELVKPHRSSHKRRGKISASEQPEHESTEPPVPKHKLPRRNHQADINRMIEILEADAEEIRDAATGDIDIDLKKRNPRRP